MEERWSSITRPSRVSPRSTFGRAPGKADFERSRVSSDLRGAHDFAGGLPTSSAIDGETHFCPVPLPRKTPSGGSLYRTRRNLRADHAIRHRSRRRARSRRPGFSLQNRLSPRRHWERCVVGSQSSSSGVAAPLYRDGVTPRSGHRTAQCCSVPDGNDY